MTGKRNPRFAREPTSPPKLPAEKEKGRNRNIKEEGQIKNRFHFAPKIVPD